METAPCPRCQQPRLCRPEAIRECPCSDILLSPAVRAYLAKQYTSCLCIACLQRIAQTLDTPPQTSNDDRTR